jgi:hypothetical protein
VAHGWEFHARKFWFVAGKDELKLRGFEACLVFVSMAFFELYKIFVHIHPLLVGNQDFEPSPIGCLSPTYNSYNRGSI